MTMKYKNKFPRISHFQRVITLVYIHTRSSSASFINTQFFCSTTLLDFAQGTQMDNNSNTENGRATLLARCSITILILLLLAIIAFSLILWLIFFLRLPEFNVESLSVSNANVSMEFKVKNPNRKINLLFSGFDVVLLHENCEILKGDVKVFSLRKRSEARMTVNWFNGGKMKNLSLDLSKKEMDFDVKMNGKAWFKSGEWINKEKSVQVLCKNLKTGDNSEADGCVSSIYPSS